ncbi:LysR family transcriptional regulator [Achromobacter marplatensis]|mgnify:FL=1|jgi:DNA-binding transcriptional LysR family regulator|uniref:DNA-binding transcriptional LysR family regulator n=1 Tax=Achromobacter marplatensis TaxID=470868 RepID=J4YK51_9BURK|nr:LysR family transcriptional regulator [Achromobacter marplatensis]EJO31383.1 LysR family transcriptional regulator [Achromobacter marplatensis]MDH2052179.1 LysR family transcriptional regulator [Achromobacter marplatensis]OWT69838.1 LysR family transcriptional regulator [Achromobacter marplatensis]RBP13941.1 DNA-binding transcriptional LysR family regulator [Achromobacter marplatensis]CAB3631374.1 HTH-type transcriptional regulator GltC [Achromobacter marplatensis]
MQINLSMRDIDTTLVLGRTLNFRQAAAQLHLSQSALSTQIQRIEEALGVRLFDRTTRTVRLTAAGEVFLQQAATLQVAFRDAIAAVSGVTSAEQGQVSVAALPSLAARLLPRVLMAYRQAHPHVALKVRDTLSGPAFDLVRAGEVDFALTAADPQHADLHYVPLMSDSFLLLIPESHPLAKTRGPLRWADTATAAHVSMVQPSSVRQYTEWAFLQNRIRFTPAFEAEHLTTIVAMVECGFGVAALPEIAAGAVSQTAIVQRPLTGPVAERSIGLVTSRNRSLSPAAAALVQTLKTYLAAHPR